MIRPAIAPPLALAMSLALALAACGEKAKAPADDNRNAEGQVLGGTISDDMLPLDTVTSQSPPLRESPNPGASGASAAADGAPRTPGEAPPETPPQTPAPEPTPEDGA